MGLSKYLDNRLKGLKKKLLGVNKFLDNHLKGLKKKLLVLNKFLDNHLKGLKKNSNNLVINQLSLNVKMLEKIWKPDTYFHNGLNSYLHTITR